MNPYIWLRKQDIVAVKLEIKNAKKKLLQGATGDVIR